MVHGVKMNHQMVHLGLTCVLGGSKTSALFADGAPVSARGVSMKIENIVLREIRMRLKAPFETSFGVTQDRRILLVEVAADGVTGWGEITAIETPSYNSETTDTAWIVVS